MQRAVAVGAKTARRHSKPAGSLTYRRSGQADQDITDEDWGMGERTSESIIDEQIENESIMQDWFIPPITFENIGFGEPQRDDILIYDGETWEVMSIQPEPAVRHSERYETHWRLHTRLVS